MNNDHIWYTGVQVDRENSTAQTKIIFSYDIQTV